MLVQENKDTSSKDPTAPAPLNDDQDQAGPSLQPDIPDDPPPPYTPSGEQTSPAVVPPPPPTSHGPPKPLCTCPRHTDTAHPANATTDRPPEGTDWAQVVKGTALVAVAVPTLAVAGAALVLPAIGFASTGVVGGSIAAAIQSSVYGGATCGLFSVLQSVGATAAAPSLLSTAAGAGAAAVGGAAIVDAAQKSDEGGEEANGGHGGGQRAAQVQLECTCVACVCDEDCECACRRRGRRA